MLHFWGSFCVVLHAAHQHQRRFRQRAEDWEGCDQLGCEHRADVRCDDCLHRRDLCQQHDAAVHAGAPPPQGEQPPAAHQHQRRYRLFGERLGEDELFCHEPGCDAYAEVYCDDCRLISRDWCQQHDAAVHAGAPAPQGEWPPQHRRIFRRLGHCEQLDCFSNADVHCVDCYDDKNICLQHDAVVHAGAPAPQGQRPSQHQRRFRRCLDPFGFRVLGVCAQSGCGRYAGVRCDDCDILSDVCLQHDAVVHAGAPLPQGKQVPWDWDIKLRYFLLTALAIVGAFLWGPVLAKLAVP
jgi:hypothetical protein